jgi:hypothetical protein
MKNEEKKPQNGKSTKIVISGKLIAVIVIIAAVCLGVGFGIKTVLSSTQKVTDIGFKNIGELATQEANVTVVKTKSEALKYNLPLIGEGSIPFTESKNIFSYDIDIKAGYDFSEIEVKPDQKNHKVTVKLPEAKILDTDLNTDSFQLYDETQGLLTHITLTDMNNAFAEMKEEAMQKAEDNGLMDKAKENAHTLIKGMLAGSYDMNEYTVEFVDQ